MKRMHVPALLLSSVIIVACGGSSSESAPDAGQTACDPVSQTGCRDGDKCTWVTVSEDPLQGRTLCRPDGTVELGDPCEEGELDQADDCKAGGLCLHGVCTQICSREPDSCTQGDRCSLFANVFEDQTDASGLPAVGACRATCDPVMQTCEGEEACYLADWTGAGACAVVSPEAATRVQDQPCLGPEPDRCYQDGCARGFDSFGIVFDEYDHGVCTQFCTPAATGVDPINGPQLDNIRGNPDGVVCGAYDPSAGEEADAECRYFNALLQTVFQDGLATPDWLGMCMSEEFRVTLDLGSCTTHDLSAEPTPENVDNGTYVIGCEPIDDLLVLNPATGEREVPGHIRARLVDLRARMLEHHGPALE